MDVLAHSLQLHSHHISHCYLKLCRFYIWFWKFFNLICLLALKRADYIFFLFISFSLLYLISKLFVELTLWLSWRKNVEKCIFRLLIIKNPSEVYNRSKTSLLQEYHPPLYAHTKCDTIWLDKQGSHKKLLYHIQFVGTDKTFRQFSDADYDDDDNDEKQFGTDHPSCWHLFTFFIVTKW